ncbi:hypothetical protein AYY17_07510 [Morganella psychrotolerans]|uniref:Fimbrial-type adhesion domain-containing protein n=2 Tax=Morganella psychrotolerans TaxID=368603 RepID=A0A1B8H6P1_9GAMM|nr:hypothetical protein AYY17_07510 [Morganella psychrotolerans]
MRVIAAPCTVIKDDNEVSMISMMNYRWLLPLLGLYATALSAACDITTSGDITRDNHLQKRIEGTVTAGMALATQTYTGGQVPVCDEQVSETVKLNAHQPFSEAPSRHYKDINGVPAYYLNEDYAYSIRSESARNFTAQGEMLTVTGRQGSVMLPGATVTLYAAVDNPRPLHLASAQIGSVKNDRNETLLKLNLSANIETVDNCEILNDNTKFEFGTLERNQLTGNPGITTHSAQNTLAIRCSDSRANKTVRMKLNNNSKYANDGESVIESDNPGLGFVLYYNGRRITKHEETELGSMTGVKDSKLTAYLYKLNQNITLGAFNGTVEYTLTFN